MLIAMLSDTLGLFKDKDADTLKWERFFESHREFIHAKDFTMERKGTHISFDKDRGDKVVYE